MPAIISDKFRILNASNFVTSIQNNTNKIYCFIGQPNAYNPEVGIGKTDWNFGPSPLDNFDQENRIKETILALKKLTSEDVRMAIRKVMWSSDQIYEMYRHDYSVYSLSQITNSSSLFESNYYIINKNYRVYICLNNGTNPENPLGRPSIDEPDFVDLEPRPAGTSGDGYIWKYLFTINPLDIIKFDNEFYVPLPKVWGEAGTESSSIKNNAINGKVETVIVKSKGSGYPVNSTFSGIPILGDGKGGEVSIETNSFGEVSNVNVTKGGSGYTKGIIKFGPGFPGVPINISTSNMALFDVIIPPKGGHGYDVYTELGAYRVIIYSRFETEELNPDVLVGNDFATIGLINNPIVANNLNYTSGLKGIKLVSGNTNYVVDEKITQTVGTGKTAIGFVASWDNETRVLRYYQSSNSLSSVGNVLHSFTSSPSLGGNIAIVGQSGNSSNINTSFTGTNVTINNREINLGSSFVSGISSSEYVSGTGEVIYIDNRQPILRSLSQKEDIKIILEF